MAAIKLDNLNGQLTLMDSAWDAVRTTIGEEFNPELRDLAEIGTDVLTWINDFVQEHPALVKGLMASAGAIGAGVVALTGVATVTKVLIPLMAELTAATPGVNIIMGVTAAVAGVVGVVTALTSATDEAVPSVKELTAAAQDMDDTMQAANDTFEETATQTLATVEVANTYIDKLDEIAAASNGAVEENQNYHNVLELLTRTMPELADSIDLENNAIEGGTAALRAHTEAWKKDAEEQAYREYMNSLYDNYNEVMTEAAENSIKLTQAQMKLETAEKNRDATMEKMNALSKEANENGEALTQEYYDLQAELNGYIDEIDQAQSAINNLNTAIDEDAEAVSAAESEINNAQDAIAQLTGTTEAQTEAEAEAARQEQELQGVIDDTTQQIQALTETYNNLYDAALQSVSGQYDLWDKADKVVATSAGSINAALESQISYWDKYNKNLESLRERTSDIEGLQEVIASFADGSTDSVNAIAGMANASDNDLKAMVENWKALQQAQSDASASIADLKTDFSNQMDELQTELADDIEAMDLGDEAAKSGIATIQGFIDGASSMERNVRDAYARLAKAAQDALSPGGVNGTVDLSGLTGYATGTQNAAPGFAVVGEDGPEVVYFNGGERVMNAQETAAMQESMQIAMIEPRLLAAYQMRDTYAAAERSAMPAQAASYTERRESDAPPSINVAIQIEGNATSETVEALRDYSNDFAERVRAVLEEIDEDRRRRAYA
jgi:chromosome segregation ATPase